MIMAVVDLPNQVVCFNFKQIMEKLLVEYL